MSAGKHLRVLPNVSPTPAATPPPYLATAAPARFDSGFFAEERDEVHAFRWMDTSGRLAFAPRDGDRYLELWVFSAFQDLSQELSVTAGDSTHRERLIHGWGQLSVPVPAGADQAVLEVNKPFPRAYYPDDPRTLAVRLSRPHLHADPRRHGHIREQHENSVLNLAETLDGQRQLRSFPRSLGIDMYGVCNVKPPCVYCEWDYNKRLEGDDVDTPFTLGTLAEWGPFFDNSVNLVNCSIGEPFMMKNFDDLLDAFGDSGKVLEMTTNGQILTDRNIQRLLGRPIDLYISLDAGTPETYAKLRNDRFDAILHNLRRLIAAKGGPGELPRVHLVFMPMRVNVHELEAFVRICADLRVDRLVLRPLNVADSITLDWTRGGYRFEYQKELLPFEELVRVSGRAAELCRRHGVALADQMDFGGAMGEEFDRWFDEGRREVAAEIGSAMTAGPAAVLTGSPPAPSPVPAGTVVAPETRAVGLADEPELAGRPPGEVAATEPAGEAPPSLGAERKPLCTEPWKSLYILRRGIFPCCYGAEPLAPMSGYHEAWNSRELQKIRATLAGGRFPTYCLKSTSCPIVQKAQQGSRLPRAQAVRLRVRRAWARLDRLGHGVPNRIYKVVHWPVAHAWRALADPSYVARHASRLTRRAPSPVSRAK